MPTREVIEGNSKKGKKVHRGGKSEVISSIWEKGECWLVKKGGGGDYCPLGKTRKGGIGEAKEKPTFEMRVWL